MSFCDFADGMLFRSGDLALVLQSYFDESISGPVLCVAGYVYTKRDARLLERDWAAMLRRWKLPYFRMSACAHRSEPFNKLTRDQCILVQTKAIGLVKKYAQFGVAVSINEDEYKAAMPSTDGLPPHIKVFIDGAYELCVWLCMQRVRIAVVEQFGHHDARIGYFFEQGHAHQSRANRLMQAILSTPEIAAAYRSIGFGFVPKEAGGPVQAADLLAWHWAKDRKSQSEGRPRRKDLASLIERAVTYMHVDAEKHAELVNGIINREMQAFSAAQSAR